MAKRSTRRRKNRPRNRTGPKVHLDNGGWAACEALTQRVTKDPEKVTCDACKTGRLNP